ncbi:MAG: phosphate ABC transporter ATP-binding protein [Anaerolineae bacterium]
MTEAIYRLRQLAKVYEGRKVLHIDSLDIERGEILAIVGPNGSGKSTLLRLLNFLESPSSGNITFDGFEIGPNSTVPLDMRRRVTMVFQRPVLLNRSVRSNVVYPLALRGRRDSQQLVRATLERARLEEIVHQRVRALSGGEVQRVSLARSMVLEPEVLLLDEPTANLDPYNVNLIEETLRAFHHECGTTLVLVTHNVFQARRIAERVVLVIEGRVVEVANVETFFEAPRDPRTAAFVRGEMVY